MSSEIQARDLQNWLEARIPITILDLRPDEQRRDWSIPTSQHANLYESLKRGDCDGLRELGLPADRPIVTVCASGVTSSVAAEQLTRWGFEAYSLEGGMRAWGRAWNLAAISFDGVEVVQVRRTGKGCLSYVIVADSDAVVIDASVDPQVYVDLAAGREARIVAVADTHIHADHLSRSRQLALALDVPLYLPDQQRVAYHFERLADGAAIPFGRTRLDVLRTPGHSWESSAYYLRGAAIFTGDTLFVDGVGRPDLEAAPGESVERAAVLHQSLARLLRLPPSVMVLPGHSSSPIEFDEMIWGVPLAEVRSHTDLLRLPKSEFVERIVGHSSAAPENHRRIVELNEAGDVPPDADDLEAGGNRCAVG